VDGTTGLGVPGVWLGSLWPQSRVIKKVPCGKDCAGCPHGPYKYIVSREDNTLNWRYEGPVDQ
jgi:hypothetical protein